MTKTIKLALVAAMAMGATSAFATNGDELIGLGAKSRAMGGTGIAHFNGAESGTVNPALITKSKGTNFAFGGTYFTPDVKISATGGGLLGAAQGPATSDAKHNVIPYVAVTENLDNGFAVGMSMYGSAGMGVDWRDSGAAGTTGAGNQLINGNLGLYGMRSNLMLLKFSTPIAYGQDDWSVGIAPVLMYGSLDMSFNNPGRNGAGGFDGNLTDVGNGSSSDFGVGYELGAAYTLPDMGLTLGLTYKSEIEMSYNDQISSVGTAFGYTAASAAGAFSDRLHQPAQIGVGIDYTEGDISITVDYKTIKWGDAEGYKDFGWEDQDVIAVGLEYRMDDLALRAGYNHAANPIKNSTDTTIVAGTLTNGHGLNALNHVMFPGITEDHYTIGAGYQFTKNVGADVAFTYATSPDVTVSATTAALGDVTVSNDQMALSANLNYSF